MKFTSSFFQDFFIRQDTAYTKYYSKNFNPSLGHKVFYLLMHLLPGIFAVLVINNKWIYNHLLAITGLSGDIFQYWCLIVVTFGWHICLPIAILRYWDGYSWPETWQYLNLNKIDRRGCLLVMPVLLVVVFLISLPYTKFIGSPLEEWLSSFPLLRVPNHSIFCCYEKIYGYPAYMLVFLFIGNFLGEELYYRGYLMKKTAFLGRLNIIVHTILFTVYHFWQIPQTYAYVGLALFFPLLMSWRKNLYVLILFHLCWNLFWPLFMSYFYYH